MCTGCGGVGQIGIVPLSGIVVAIVELEPIVTVVRKVKQSGKNAWSDRDSKPSSYYHRER